MNERAPRHTVRSGAGLVIANMIGVGVLLSAGFMAQDMSAGPILLAWVVGIVISFLGVISYSAIVAAIQESGGEYRFLSDLVHPFLGYLAGWGSLILGFSAPIAVNAHSIGAFTNTLVDGPDPRVVAAIVVVAFTAMHGLSLRVSHLGQNTVVVIKLVAFAAFALLALILGTNSWPDWTPANPSAGFPWRKLIENQYWIAFAFSGWNAAIYTAKEFKNPARDVPRAMLLGFGVVSLLYLVINVVFVTNLTPEQATAVFTYEQTRITLAHLVSDGIFGSIGGRLTSILVIWAFASSISAMMMIAPRVYVAMARDGFLPRIFTAKHGEPPFSSTVLQAAVSLLFIFSHSLRETVQAASAFLMLFTALTALALFRLRRVHPAAAPAPAKLVVAVVFAFSIGVILYTNLQSSPQLWYTLGAVTALALAGYLWARRGSSTG
ncbi:MAG: amino acid permease [Acidobacteria bacterium]|nr:amino acid permease [Acidobacteriota bacterium]NIM63868.1 amino acid permease [Acidobacteriota bacterium]NIO60137.1 amino acid permease [Acidobacteriota bacterium]NIQ31201.1 amino acid permease [Acidobacteriota bacterium]NIQ86338.1 amino acid permease [Acidobacteriota bacterium]